MTEEEKDQREELDAQIALEKMAIPTPEKTIEAALIKAQSVVARLGTFKKSSLSEENYKKLESIAAELPGESPEVVDDPKQTAENFEAYCNDCENKIEAVRAARVEASKRMTALAHKVESCKKVNASRVIAHVQNIINSVVAAAGDKAEIVDKSDIQKNLTNITMPSRGDKSLKNQIDWQKLEGKGVTKMTKLQDMTVEQLKEVLLAIKGNR